MENDKQLDKQTLEQLNKRIGFEESKGDDESLRSLDSMIAPRLALRRSDGMTFDDRKEFLEKVSPSGHRETEVVSIDLYGDRAFVVCIVTMQSPDGDKKRIHNLRLFVRHEKQWKLLGWANEPM